MSCAPDPCGVSKSILRLLLWKLPNLHASPKIVARHPRLHAEASENKADTGTGHASMEFVGAEQQQPKPFRRGKKKSKKKQQHEAEKEEDGRPYDYREEPEVEEEQENEQADNEEENEQVCSQPCS